MAPTFRHVACTEIALDDDTCIVTYRPQIQALAHSVARVGVLTPLHLRHVGDAPGLQIVSGAKRLQACQQAGQHHVPALVYSAEELSDEAAFLLAVHENLGCRGLNTVEKGRVLWRLQHRFRYPATTLIDVWCPLLELPPRAATLDAYCTLATLDEVLQAATVEGGLPLETALWIGRQTATDRQALLTLFTELKLGSNRAREFVTLIDDVCHRDGCAVAMLLRELGMAERLDDTSLSGPQKIEQMRHALRARRYPRLQAHERRFQEAVRQLRLPPQVSLQPPPYFDGHQYQVSFRFGTHEELQDYARRLLDAASAQALHELLTLL